MPGDADRLGDARAATLALLDRRTPGATVCPSEVARALATDWRGAMPIVHAAIDDMLADGVVRLSWKGVVLATRDGPYRIGRVED
ncbi:DUF3253 domain-containing protein [Sphingomonas bacterium]|uniref:DUF3253 domain-containing protein n=1 Tax=Sphingomonas bacterium TaxID=1895847 RepID=UPI0020C5DDB6|nr:DUF3253 domain-containing protein [Sphingomonas bacterium]